VDSKVRALANEHSLPVKTSVSDGLGIFHRSVRIKCSFPVETDTAPISLGESP